MAFERTRRASDPRQAAEAAFKAATTKTADKTADPAPGTTSDPASTRPAVAAPAAPGASTAVPGAREMVTLRIDRAVLEHFQKDGPGWQDRVNAALKAVVGL